MLRVSLILSYLVTQGSAGLLVAEQAPSSRAENATAVSLEQLSAYLRKEESAMSRIHFEVTEKYATVTDRGEEPSSAYNVNAYFVQGDKFFQRIRRFEGNENTTTEGTFDGSTYTAETRGSNGFSSLVRHELRGSTDAKRYSVMSSANVFRAIGYSFPERLAEMETFVGLRSSLLSALQAAPPDEITATHQEIAVTVKVPDTTVIAWNSSDLGYWRKQWDRHKLSAARRAELEEAFARMRVTPPVRLTKFTYRKEANGFKLTQIEARSPTGEVLTRSHVESWQPLGNTMNFVAAARIETWSDPFTPSVLGHPRYICRLALVNVSSTPKEELTLANQVSKPAPVTTGGAEKGPAHQ